MNAAVAAIMTARPAVGLVAVLLLFAGGPVPPVAAAPPPQVGEPIDGEFNWVFTEARSDRGRMQAFLTLGQEVGEEIVVQARCEARSSSANEVPVEISVLSDGLAPGTRFPVTISAADRGSRSYEATAHPAGPNFTTAMIRLGLDDPLWDEFAIGGGLLATGRGGSVNLLRTYYADRVTAFVSRCKTFMRR